MASARTPRARTVRKLIRAERGHVALEAFHGPSGKTTLATSTGQCYETPMREYNVFYEATPNPQSLKFIVTAMIADESVNFTSAAEATRSPLAQKILGFPWAAGVFIGPHFVTVTKQDWVDWDVIADPLSELIREHLQAGSAVLLEPVGEPGEDSNADREDDLPIVRQIKQILRDEIRPAVAMDGGDITFDRYQQGRVYLHMQGACAGCPSSAFTLKEGIETRLREAIPEVQEVVSV